jgi:hypothetical protein
MASNNTRLQAKNTTNALALALAPNTLSNMEPSPSSQEFRGIEAYSTTTTLLVIMHVLFLYHWWTRKSRKRILVSYKTLIQKKHYHKALVAILSHPPTRSSNNNNELYLAQFVPTFLRDWYNSSAFTGGRHLSGLPLLFYNAHLLWNCRALEGHFYDSIHDEDVSSSSSSSSTITLPYARALWGLTLVAMALDLGFTGYVLRMIRDMNHATSAPTGASSRPEVVRQVESVLCHRTMGGLTTTTCAALALFRHQFPFIPIQVLPLVLPTWIPLLSIPSISYAFAISILLALNQSVHPIASVIFGTLSGVLWSPLNLTNFLVEDYWSNGTILAYLFASLFSLKAAGASSWVPCIDHVSWDDQGQRTYDSPESARFEQQAPDDDVEAAANDNNINNSMEDDDEDASNHSFLEEQELPLYTNNNSNSNNINDTQELRHRLPIMTDMDDNDDDDEADSFLGSNSRPTPPTMRSRRMRP